MLKITPPSLFGALLVCSALLASCQKETLSDRINIFAEGIGNTGAKMSSPDGAILQWEEGETLTVNGEEKAVANDGGSWYVTGVAEADSYLGVYPASMEASYSAGVLSYTLPRTYQHRRRTVTPFEQIAVEPPMAAYRTASELESEGGLYFRHLTGALTIRITNNTGCTLILDSIIVTSSTYALCGSGFGTTLSTMTMASRPAAATANRTVSMRFDDQEYSIGTSTNSTLVNYKVRDIQIPVPEVGADNKFTITIVAHSRDGGYNILTRYIYDRTQSEAGRLERGKLGWVDVDMTSASQDFGTCGSYTVGPMFSTTTRNDSTFYTISTVEEFVRWRTVASSNDQYPSNGNYYRNANYLLLNDIDLTGVTLAPISTPNNTFLFDGGGHTLTGLTLVNGNNTNCGLIAAINTGTRTFRNLTLRNFTLRSGATSVTAGVLVGQANGGYIVAEHVDIVDPIFDLPNATSPCVGGAVGSGYTMSLTDCNVEMSPSLTGLTNTIYFGGLVGSIMYVGGSSSFDCSFTDCDVSLDATAAAATNSAVYAGGMVGYNNGGTSTTVTFNDGSVGGTLTATTNGTRNVGAVVGWARSEQSGVDVSSVDVSGLTIN